MRTVGGIPRVLFAALLVWFAGHAALAGVIFVDDDAPLGGDGEDWATAYHHLQDADMQDFGVVQRCWSGANQAADPACAD